MSSNNLPRPDRGLQKMVKETFEGGVRTRSRKKAGKMGRNKNGEDLGGEWWSDGHRRKGRVGELLAGMGCSCSGGAGCVQREKRSRAGRRSAGYARGLASIGFSFFRSRVGLRPVSNRLGRSERTQQSASARRTSCGASRVCRRMLSRGMNSRFHSPFSLPFRSHPTPARPRAQFRTSAHPPNSTHLPSTTPRMQHHPPPSTLHPLHPLHALTPWSSNSASPASRPRPAPAATAPSTTSSWRKRAARATACPWKSWGPTTRSRACRWDSRRATER